MAAGSLLLSAEIWIYPIKSCGGISLPAEKLGPFSFRRDRRWMIVRDDTKRFLTQRQYPKMSLITPTWDSKNDCAIYSAPGMGRKLTIPFKGIQPNGPRYDVGIWDDTCPAIDEVRYIFHFPTKVASDPDSCAFFRVTTPPAGSQSIWDSLSDLFVLLMICRERPGRSTVPKELTT
jgi:hypothetical protein